MDSESLLNNEDQNQSEEKSDNGATEEEEGQEQSTDSTDEGTKDGESDKTADKDDDVPFHEHPRFKALITEVKESRETTAAVLQEIQGHLASIQETVAKVKAAESQEEYEAAIAELDELDKNPPKSFKDIFKKFEKIRGKLTPKPEPKAEDEKKPEDKKSDAEDFQEKTANELRAQAHDLIEMGKLTKEELTPFGQFCAEKLEKGESPSIFGNFHAALPYWREKLAKDAETDKKSKDDKERRGIGPSGGEGSGKVKVSMEEMRNVPWSQLSKYKNPKT